jgi:hypothetical protein
MNHPRPLLQDLSLPLGDVRASKLRRLGTVLHQLAVDLAQERRRTAALERELAELRAERTRRTSTGGAPAGAVAEHVDPRGQGGRDDHIERWR